MSFPQLDLYDSSFPLAAGNVDRQLDIHPQMPGAFPVHTAITTSLPLVHDLFSLSPLSSPPSSEVESSELEVHQNYLLNPADWSSGRFSEYCPGTANSTTLQHVLVYVFTAIRKHAHSIDPWSWIQALYWVQLEKMDLTMTDSSPVLKRESRERPIPQKYTTNDMSTSLSPALLLSFAADLFLIDHDRNQASTLRTLGCCERWIRTELHLLRCNRMSMYVHFLFFCGSLNSP